MGKIRLLTVVGALSGPKIALMPLGCKGQSPQPKTATMKERRVAVREKTSRTLLLASPERRLSEPADTFLFPAWSPLFRPLLQLEGYFIEPQMEQEASLKIKPPVRCPKDGRLMYLARCQREMKELPPLEMPRM